MSDSEINSIVDRIPEKSKKTYVIIISAVVLIMLVTGVVVFFLKSSRTQSQISIAGISIASYSDVNKTIIQPRMDGTVAQYDNSEVYRTVLTPDRSKIIVQTNNKELYYTNADGTGKTMITDDCEALESLFSGVYEKGVIYVDCSGLRHRYLFDGAADAKISENAGPITVSEKNMNIAYIANDGVYLLTERAENRKKIKSLEGNTAAIISVSNDGNMLFWYELDDENKHIYMYYNGENIKIDSYKREKGYAVSVAYDEKQSYALLRNTAEGKLYIIDSAGNIESVCVEDGSISHSQYTVNNIINYDDRAGFSGLYFATVCDKNTTVYYLDNNYDYQPVVEAVKAYAVYAGHIYYIDENNTLMYGKLNKNKISDEKAIDTNVEAMHSLLINGYLYYMKDVKPADRTGTMYVFKIGENTVKIDSGITADFYDTYITADGRTVVYLKSLVLHESNIIGATGTLCRYILGTEGPEKLDSKVIRSSLQIGYKDRMYDGGSVIYKKSVSSDKNSITGDLYYYDGVECVKLADGVF